MIVLDSSALLAMLLGEPGGDRVAAVLEDAAMTTVNLAEVVGYYARSGAAAPETRKHLSPLSIHHVAVDIDMAYDIGQLLPVTRGSGLSLGDRACLALARRLGVPALTADRQWAAIAGSAGIAVEVIR